MKRNVIFLTYVLIGYSVTVFCAAPAPSRPSTSERSAEQHTGMAAARFKLQSCGIYEVVALAALVKTYEWPNGGDLSTHQLQARQAQVASGLEWINANVGHVGRDMLTLMVQRGKIKKGCLNIFGARKNDGVMSVVAAVVVPVEVSGQLDASLVRVLPEHMTRFNNTSNVDLQTLEDTVEGIFRAAKP